MRTTKLIYEVKAFAQMCGGHCGIGKSMADPKGWTVEITDKTIWPSDAA